MTYKNLVFVPLAFLLIFSMLIAPVSAFTTASPGYNNNQAPANERVVVESRILVLDISLPDPASDSVLAGTAPSAGTSLTTTNPWASATVPVYFYDAGTSGVWESASDGIFTDNDQDGVYTSAADTVVDCDGADANDPRTAGTCTSISDGTTLVAVASTDNLCADSLTNPTCVWTSAGAGTDNVLCTADDTLGTIIIGAVATPCAPADHTQVDSSWAYYEDVTANSAYDVGEDLYIENVAGELTYSSGPDANLTGSGTPIAGTAINTANPWASAAIPVAFYDAGTTGTWEAGSDVIVTDDDQSGYFAGDKLTSIKVVNTGTALDSDLSAIKVWQEDGTTVGFQANEDTLIGSDSTSPFLDQVITLTAPVYTASSKDRLYITMDIARGAVNNRTIQASFPTNSIQFASTNDGPTDTAIVNAYIQVIKTISIPDDTAAPSSSITDPADGAVIEANKDYLITGISSDTGGSSVKKVEISLDGGKTWAEVIPVASSDSGFTWKYLWTKPVEGTYNLKTRAVDYFGNIETPGQGIFVNVVAPSIETEEQKEEQPTEEKPQEASEEKPISEMTAEEIQLRIIEIQNQIARLLEELALLKKTETVIKFTQTLKYGMKGDEVRALQECLAKDSSVYPEGLVTGYFGPLTRSAVIRFQEKYADDVLAPWGLTKGTGIVGKTTRAKLNEICQ